MVAWLTNKEPATGMTGPDGTSTEDAATARRPKARDLNELVRYTMWSVFRVADRMALEAGGLGNAAAEVADCLTRRRARASSPAAATTSRVFGQMRTSCSGGSRQARMTCKTCT